MRAMSWTNKAISHIILNDFSTHLTICAQIDIVLDLFPRTIGTTTAEALWMGVPVITLAGQRQQVNSVRSGGYDC